VGLELVVVVVALFGALVVGVTAALVVGPVTEEFVVLSVPVPSVSPVAFGSSPWAAPDLVVVVVVPCRWALC
jgi:hypothetical protein